MRKENPIPSNTEAVLIPQVKERNLNFELLRIVAMFMVVLLHVNLMGGVLRGVNYNENLSGFLVSRFMEYLCIIAVNLYVMISGYYLSASARPFKMAKLLHILCMTMFWSWLIGGAACYFLGANLNSFIMTGIFPVLGRNYWFVTDYVVMYLLSPFYNRLLAHLSQKQHGYLLCVLGFFFSLVIGAFDPIQLVGGYSLYWFTLLYILAAYIRKYPVSIKRRSYALVWILVLLLQIFAYSLCHALHLDFIAARFFDLNYNSIWILINSICCFMIFKDMQVKRGARLIKFLAPLTFGIYLIHINKGIVNWLFQELLPIKDCVDQTGWVVFLYILFFTVLVFTVCALLEKLRMTLYECFTRVIDIEKKILNLKIVKRFNIDQILD